MGAYTCATNLSKQCCQHAASETCPPLFLRNHKGPVLHHITCFNSCHPFSVRIQPATKTNGHQLGPPPLESVPEVKGWTEELGTSRAHRVHYCFLCLSNKTTRPRSDLAGPPSPFQASSASSASFFILSAYIPMLPCFCHFSRPR